MLLAFVMDSVEMSTGAMRQQQKGEGNNVKLTQVSDRVAGAQSFIWVLRFEVFAFGVGTWHMLCQ